VNEARRGAVRRERLKSGVNEERENGAHKQYLEPAEEACRMNGCSVEAANGVQAPKRLINSY
jgi:hypothetical protein